MTDTLEDIRVKVNIFLAYFGMLLIRADTSQGRINDGAIPLLGVANIHFFRYFPKTE